MMHIYEEKTFKLASEIVNKYNVFLEEVSWVKEHNTFFLRLIIDKDGGVDINDCTNVSEELSKLLDKEDFIKEEYILEVSSPGIEKELKTNKDIIDAVGKYVHVSLYAKKDNVKEIDGDLLSFENDVLKIEALIKGRKKIFEINKQEISKIRLAVKF